jgi:hypothetical protein
MIGFLSLFPMWKDLLNNRVAFLVNDGAPTNAVTGKDIAGKGSCLIDKANGKLYINTGVVTSPTWTLVGSQT